MNEFEEEKLCCLKYKEKIAELEAEISRLQSNAGWEYERQRQTYDKIHRSNYGWK